MTLTVSMVTSVSRSSWLALIVVTTGPRPMRRPTRREAFGHGRRLDFRDVEEASVERVGVVGCGLMGSGIAEVTARAGARVTVVERDEEALAGGREGAERALPPAGPSGKMAAEK